MPESHNLSSQTASDHVSSHQEQVFLLLRKFFFSPASTQEFFARFDKTQDSSGNNLVKLLRTVKLKFTARL